MYTLKRSIIKVSYFAGCAVMYSCYKINLQEPGMWFTDLTNSRCESYCKDDAAKNKYYGTSVSLLYV